MMQSSNFASRLSPKQTEVLEALLSGSTISEAAAKADVHRSTVHLWCRENTIFRAAFRDAESQQATIVLDGLRGLATRAIETLEHLMTDPATPAGVKLRAATMVIQTVAQSDPYTKPAEPRLTTGDVDKIIEASAKVGGEESVLREAARQQPVEATVCADAPATTETQQTARNAPCPCGSGDKFKRCCGKNAPGIFGQARAA